MTDKTPDVIYLIHGDSPSGYDWCDDPAPSEDHNPDEAIKYVKAGTDKHTILDGAIERIGGIGPMDEGIVAAIDELEAMRDDNSDDERCSCDDPYHTSPNL